MTKPKKKRRKTGIAVKQKDNYNEYHRLYEKLRYVPVKKFTGKTKKLKDKWKKIRM